MSDAASNVSVPGEPGSTTGGDVDGSSSGNVPVGSSSEAGSGAEPDAAPGADGGSVAAPDGGATSPDGGSAHPDAGSTHDGGTTNADAGGGTTSTVANIPGAVAGPGTTLQGCQVFPNDNAWNVQVDGPSVQIIHTYDANIAPGTHLHPDWGGYATNNGGIPFNVVPASQPELDTTFSAYASVSDPGPGGWIGTNPVTTGADVGTTAWPFFLGMEIEGDPAPGSGGTPGSLPGDQHGIALLQGASGCMLYEAWNCVAVTSTPFNCANGAAFDLTSNALRPAGWTSADAAGLPITAGLVRLSEVQAGLITHALRVTFNTTQQGYIAPATHAAGSEPLGSAYPPMGLRLRMKASVSTAGFTTMTQTIMAAMKKYGVIIADNGSDWFLTGDSDDGWNATAPDGNDSLINEIVDDFRSIDGSDFEVVYSGDPVSTGL